VTVLVLDSCSSGQRVWQVARNPSFMKTLLMSGQCYVTSTYYLVNLVSLTPHWCNPAAQCQCATFFVSSKPCYNWFLQFPSKSNECCGTGKEKCTGGKICVNGECECPANFIDCDGECIVSSLATHTPCKGSYGTCLLFVTFLWVGTSNSVGYCRL
jgi:hypothetical protein